VLSAKLDRRLIATISVTFANAGHETSSSGASHERGAKQTGDRQPRGSVPAGLGDADVSLGADYGISGNGLKKICDRLNVPYPDIASVTAWEYRNHH
jgi:hypothetical protein